jgi:hypothetical protein
MLPVLGAEVVSLFVIVQFFTLQKLMRNSGWFCDDGGEYSFDSFGQTVPLTTLTLPFLTLVEALASVLVYPPPISFKTRSQAD